MKQLGLWCVVLAGVACTKAEDVDREIATRKIAEARATVPVRPVTAAPPGTLERRLLDLASCGLEGYQIDSGCPAMTELQHELAQPGGAKELSLALGTQLLANTSPAVRIETSKLMGTDAQSLAAIVAAARREPRAEVRQAFVRLLASDAVTHPAVGAFLLESAGHADARVRLQALDALTAPESRTVPGRAARLIAMVETDPDAAVRRAACTASGKLGDDALLPMFERATARTDDPALYGACMEGLVAMFHDHATFATASEGAYRLFLTRLAATPRSEQTPPWSVMSAFCYSSHQADLDKLAAWKQRAPWFDAAEVKRVISSIIADPSASWMARTAGVESLVGLGATPAELASLARGIDDRRVLDKLAGALPE